MKKKYSYLLVVLVIVIAGGWIYLKTNSCKEMGCRIEEKCKGHFVPGTDTLNVIKVNSTIVFVDYEREGVTLHDYGYYKSIDAGFFKNIDEESFRNNGEAGGYLATVRIYQALKKGDTEIIFYKKQSISHQQENDTTTKEPEAVATYKFHIE
jgi:hypothetical protein